MPGSTSRDASAYSSVVSTRSASARAEVSQATTRRENASRIAESHNGPSPVGIIVRSVTHSWFGPVARLLTRVLHGFYAIVHNYGIAIVLLTAFPQLATWLPQHMRGN